VNVSKSSDPERLNTRNICVANVSDQVFISLVD